MNYPRPQLVRKSWQSLDGEWLMNNKTISVPSCQIEEHLTYEKHFEYVKEKEVTLLHFEGVDQIADIYLNDNYIGKHIGGYLPFSFDISKYVIEGDNYLKVVVKDELDHTYPYGKQRKDRGGMWYTPVSGIWKSVWLEQVPKRYIESVKINSDLTGVNLKILINEDSNIFVKEERIDIESPELWTPENPKLYYHTLKEDEDEVEIYFALRKIEIKNINGINRVCLNNKPIFLHGLLDQGYYYPGVMTPMNFDAYKEDIKFVKDLGFNTLRKHIKIEPEEFYYECDKQGILVIQDMVNSGDYHFFKDTVLGTLGLKLSDKKKQDERMDFFVEHSKNTITHLYNHPCIIAYTIFNEGWGQFNSDDLYKELKMLDPSRLYDSTSGWFKQNNSDFDSEHIYFRLKNLKPKIRPLLVSECGGYSLNLNNQNKSYGYGSCKNAKELTDKMIWLYEKMIIPAIKDGLAGCIYTQASDIEDEINGLISYDRKTIKVEERLKDIATKIKAEIENV